jgi:hypothetical protein
MAMKQLYIDSVSNAELELLLFGASQLQCLCMKLVPENFHTAWQAMEHTPLLRRITLYIAPCPLTHISALARLDKHLYRQGADVVFLSENDIKKYTIRSDHLCHIE